MDATSASSAATACPAWKRQDVVSKVLAETRRRQLLPASGLVEELVSSPKVTSALLKELLVGQYHVAKEQRRWDWVQRLQRELNGVADASWILDNLPCPSASMNRVQLPRKTREQVYDPVTQCQDIRVAAGQVKVVQFVDSRSAEDPAIVRVDQQSEEDWLEGVADLYEEVSAYEDVSSCSSEEQEPLAKENIPPPQPRGRPLHHGAGRGRKSRRSRRRSRRRPTSPRVCGPDVRPGTVPVEVSRKRKRSSSRTQRSAETAQTGTVRCSLCGHYSSTIHRHYRRAHPDTAEGRILHVAQSTSSCGNPQVLLTLDKPTGQKLEVYDSHFHADRMIANFGLAAAMSLEEVASTPVSRERPDHPVTVMGGVAVYCDPRSYPKTVAVSPRFTVAIGCHPKKVTHLTPEKEQQLQRLLQHPRVALGEIGLDWTEPMHTWDLQLTVFRRLLSSSCTRRPLVLHLRDGRQHQGVFSRALEQVRRDCAPNQPIHLHCFTGDEEDLCNWREAFPSCYFGFTGLVFKFTSAQTRALRRVPSTRLLLETDSPHLHPTQRNNSPQWIGTLAHHIARLRSQDVHQLVREANLNARSLYSLQ